MNRRTNAWQNACLRKMDDHLVNATPNQYLPKIDALPKNRLQIILTAKLLVQHSSMSPKQQRRPLPSVCFFFYAVRYERKFLLTNLVSRFERLVEDNCRKEENDKDMEEELKEMVETYRQQGAQIMEMKALLMRYLMKSGTVDTTAQKSKRYSRNKEYISRYIETPLPCLYSCSVGSWQLYRQTATAVYSRQSSYTNRGKASQCMATGGVPSVL